MRVLVTGGAGFIGSHLVRALVARGDDVVILDVFDDAYDPRIKERNVEGLGVELLRGDVRDPQMVARATRGIDAVVHLAARAGVRESLRDPLLYDSVNVRGLWVLLDALHSQAGVHMVFASSSSVYGARQDGPFREDDPADRPVSPYAATKRAGELVCYAAHASWGLPVTCLRFFTVYGPRQRPTMAISHFIHLALSGQVLPLFGDGSSSRDYTWAGDVVSAIVAALDRPQGYAVINVGSARPIRLDDLSKAIGEACQVPVRVRYLPVQPGDVPRTFADITRARTSLGWAPTMSLASGLRATADWVRATT